MLCDVVLQKWFSKEGFNQFINQYGNQIQFYNSFILVILSIPWLSFHWISSSIFSSLFSTAKKLLPLFRDCPYPSNRAMLNAAQGMNGRYPHHPLLLQSFVGWWCIHGSVPAIQEHHGAIAGNTSYLVPIPWDGKY